MANVKFYQGILDHVGNNPDNAIGFVAKDATEKNNGNYGYIYLGGTLAATKYLSAMNLDGFTAGAGLLEIGSSGSPASPILTTRSITTSYSSGSWESGTNVPTTGAIASYVSSQISSNDKYHTLGSDFGGTTWYQATLTGQNSAGDITLTLPIADPSAAGYDYSTDNTHITTPKQVSDFFSGLSGGMRYMGELTSNEVGDTDGKIKRNGKPGDVYICGNANGITVGTDPQRVIEYGDMIVLNTNYTANTILAYSNSKWNFDQFERNLDGSVKISSPMTSGKFVTSTGTDTITSMSTDIRGAIGSIIVGAGSNADPTWFAKSSTAGQILKTGSSTIEWVDYYYQTVVAHSTDANKIVVTPYTNGTAGTATTITINDVENADKVKQTVSSTDSDKPILIGAGGTSGTAQAVNYSSSISANASTGTITATEMTLGTSGSTINVYSTLTWQTIPSS